MKDLLVWGLISVLCAVILLMMFSCTLSRATFCGKGYIVEPNDPNCAVEFRGKAAELVAEPYGNAISDNLRTAQGRENALFDALNKCSIPLVGLFVGGLIFWAITRSKWGWIIPVSAVAGLGLITLWAEIAKYIVYGIVALGFLVVVWKAYEYQKERNDKIDEIKEIEVNIGKNNL